MTDAAPPAPRRSLADIPRAIATPCIKVCIIDGQSSLCLGCFRKLSEVAAWGKLSDQERADIMAVLPGRRDQIDPKKLGLL